MSADERPSEVYAFRPDFTWSNVEVRRYKPEAGDWEGIMRQVITGWGHETQFQVRYFEISPGGHSSLEKHEHAHVVICVRGQGDAVVGAEQVCLRPFDVLYLKPWEPHQFVNRSDAPFGFLCIVNSERDRPQSLDAEEIAAVKAGPAGTIARMEAPQLKRLESEQ